MAKKLSELAALTGCVLQGEDCLIDNVADVTQAGEGHLAFVYNPKYLDKLAECRASALIIKPDWIEQWDGSAILSDDPRLSFAKVAALLNPVKVSTTGIATTAVIDESVTVPGTAAIGHHVVLQAGVSLGENVQIGAGSVITENVSIGDATIIHPNVTISHGTAIGRRCTIYSGVIIGADGFGYVRDGERYIPVPQIGNVVIGDDVDIGANSTVDRGALLDTVIHDGVKLDNQIQVAHNVVIGENTVISAYTGIAGSAKIGKNCLIGGGVGIRDNIEIADNVTITGRTFVSSSIKESGSYSSSVLVDSTRNWKKNVMRFKHLDDLAKRVKKLENSVES